MYLYFSFIIFNSTISLSNELCCPIRSYLISPISLSFLYLRDCISFPISLRAQGSICLTFSSVSEVISLLLWTLNLYFVTIFLPPTPTMLELYLFIWHQFSSYTEAGPDRMGEVQTGATLAGMRAQLHHTPALWPWAPNLVCYQLIGQFIKTTVLNSLPGT